MRLVFPLILAAALVSCEKDTPPSLKLNVLTLNTWGMSPFDGNPVGHRWIPIRLAEDKEKRLEAIRSIIRCELICGQFDR